MSHRPKNIYIYRGISFKVYFNQIRICMPDKSQFRGFSSLCVIKIADIKLQIYFSYNKKIIIIEIFKLPSIYIGSQFPYKNKKTSK